MANYPTSDPAFATRNTGDTIQASHVNEIGAEVVAIGSALRGTQQHGIATTGSVTAATGLTVSTGATVLGQSLSVAGESTLTGAVTISSNVSIGGSVTSTLVLASVLRVPIASTTLSGGSTLFNDVVLPSSGVMIRVSGNSTAIAVSGFSPAGVGRVIFVVNVETAAALTLLNEDANSSATSRLQLGGANRTVAAGGMTTLAYDNVTGRWRG